MDIKHSKIVCDECKNEFYEKSSIIKNLCPECAHILYGYENCNHEFINNRCKNCYWNGNSSDYANKIKK